MQYYAKNLDEGAVSMGFYFRKSKSLGPARLNMSKSGLGVSTGVKGARVSFGPSGTYVNLGKNGIYYRKKIGGRSSKASKQRDTKNSPSSVAYSQQPRVEQNTNYDYSDAIRVYDNSYSDSVLGKEILKDVKRSHLFIWLWIVISIASIVLLKEWGLLVLAISALVFWRFFTARVIYDLEQEADFEWQKLTEVLFGLRTSNRLWLVEQREYNSNRKVSAGADASVTRGTASVLAIKPNRKTGFGIKTNVNSFAIKSSKCQILFIPSGIIVKKGSKTVAYSYDQINIISSTVNFVEDGSIVKDAEVIRHTWQYVNKDGSPDRRFNNNRQLPVCRYGVISINGANINIDLQTSNSSVSANVGSAYSHYKLYFAKIGSAPVNTQISQSSEKSVVPSSIHSSQDYSHHISQEEWSLLEEMNDNIRDLGKNGYIDVLKKELGCKVKFIDAQLHQKHALLLYRADKEVEDQLKRLEYSLNANTQYDNKVEAVSENEFLIHLYMDPFSDTKKELPLSKDLEEAISKAEKRKTMPKKSRVRRIEKEDDYDYQFDDVGDYDDILSSGASLFSGDLGDTKSNVPDPYGDLFVPEKDKKTEEDNSPVDDLLNFFEEE